MAKQRAKSRNWMTVGCACLALSIGACDSGEANPDGVFDPGVGGSSAAPSNTGAKGGTGTVDSTTAVPGTSAPTSSVPTGTTPTTPGTPALDASTGVGADAASASGSSWCQAKAIFDKSCIGCHDGKGSSGSPMGLTKYDVYVAPAPASSGKKVYEAIAARLHDAARPMPPKANLARADLELLEFQYVLEYVRR